ncbi:MAG: TlpA disulfide reductase family protein [Pseudohongiellaceae bacterium]
MRLLTILLMLSAGTPALSAQVGEPAPDFALPGLYSSASSTLGDYRGKIIYLDFWASWCPPCLVSIPLLNELRNKYAARGADFEIVAVNVDTDPEDGRDFLLDNPVDYVVLSDPEGTVPGQYEIRGMPSSFLIDSEGRIRLAHEGFKRSDIEMIEARLVELLEEME